jgi:hypothetical protein
MYEKIKRTALIMAIADDADHPTVTLAHLAYAEKLEISLTDTLKWHMIEGQLSGAMEQCVAKIRHCIVRYGATSADKYKSVNQNRRTVGRAWFTEILPMKTTYVKSAIEQPPCHGSRDRFHNELVSRLRDLEYLTIVYPDIKKGQRGRKAEEQYILSHITEEL